MPDDRRSIEPKITDKPDNVARNFFDRVIRSAQWLVREVISTEVGSHNRIFVAQIYELTNGLSKFATALEVAPSANGAATLREGIEKLYRDAKAMDIVEGKTSVEVGAVLNLSPKSIDTYRSRMMKSVPSPVSPLAVTP